MSNISENIHAEEAQERARLLAQRVEEDIAEVLQEYGSQEAEPELVPVPVVSRKRLAYGIPMAGVRYYTFEDEE